MIPAAGRAWRPVASLPLRRSHPAARLAAGLLAVLSALFWPPLALVPLACLLGACLWRSGWRPAGAASLLRAWLPVVLVVLVAHTVSAVDAAPLGRPTWLGLSRGVLALCRLALVIAAGALLLRLLPLPDLTVALTWWLRPLEPLGVDTGHLGVTLAVALGTAPRTHAEAARIRACLRLRRADRGGDVAACTFASCCWSCRRSWRGSRGARRRSRSLWPAACRLSRRGRRACRGRRGCS